MTRELTALKDRICAQSNDELIKMVSVDHSDYRRETLDFASDELIRRGFEVNKVGPDFIVVTPDHIKLRPSSSASQKMSPLAMSFAVGPGGIPAWAFIVAAGCGVVVPLLVVIILALPFILPSQSCLQTDSLSMILLLGLLMLVAIILTYAGLGAIFGYKWPEHSWRWGLWVTVPGITLSFAMRGLFKTGNPLTGVIGFVIGSVLLVALPACVGAHWGVRRKERKWRGPGPY